MAAQVTLEQMLEAGTDIAEHLDYITEDANGNHTYSNDKALYGFIPAGHYLLIPAGFDTLCATDAEGRTFPDIGKDVIGGTSGIMGYLGGSELGSTYRDNHSYAYFPDRVVAIRIAFMNYLALRDAEMSQKDAFVVSMLRARWCVLGAWAIARDDETRPFSEHTIVAAVEIGSEVEQVSAAETELDIFCVNEDRAREFLSEMLDEETGIAFVIRVAETIWCAEEFIMRVRGHHYKPEYETLLKKYVSACHEMNLTIPESLDLAHLFRTAIHPFGVSALPTLAAHFMIHGKIGNAGLLRMTAAPNGMAVICTTLASLMSMSSETWYAQFYNTYKDQIRQLEQLDAAVKANKYGFHMSARLYGVQPVASVTIGEVIYTIDKMKAIGANLAALGQGYIEAMREALNNRLIEGFSFSNAKVLQKYAANAPLTSLKIKNLVMYAVEAIKDSKSITQATNAALPAIRAEQT